MKIIKKVIILIFIVMIIQIICSANIVSATGGDDLFDNMTTKVEKWETMGSDQLNKVGVDTSSLLKPVLAVAQILYWVGCVVVIIITILHFIGILSKDGEKKSLANKRNLGWLITCFVLIGAPRVWAALVGALDTLS